MSIPQAIFLGLTQGLTEFLPISSSGHLVLFQQFLGFTNPPIAFDSLIHVATLAAVFIYFRKQLPLLLQQKLPHLILGTLPAVVFGLLIYLYALDTFSSLPLLSLGFLVTSLLLFLSHQIQKPGQPLKNLNRSQSLLVGLSQALAILPSISRSGATIATGRFAGLDKAASFTFSFILSIPAILGALALTGGDLFTPQYPLAVSLAGFLTAFFSGLFSLKLLDLLFKKYSLLPFAWYTLFLGLLIAGLIF